MKCNDERVRKHEEGKKAYEAKTLNQPDDVHDIKKLDDTNHINKADDTDRINDMDNDGMFRPNKPSVVDTNHPPIKNCSKEINNKKIDVVSSFFTERENEIRSKLEKKIGYIFANDYRWKRIFNYIAERQESGQSIQDLVDYLLESEFNMKFMTLAKLEEIYMNEIRVSNSKKTIEPQAWTSWFGSGYT